MQSAYERLLKIYNFKKMVYKKTQDPRILRWNIEEPQDILRGWSERSKDDRYASRGDRDILRGQIGHSIPKNFRKFSKNSRAESLLIYSQNPCLTNRKCKKAAFPVGWEVFWKICGHLQLFAFFGDLYCFALFFGRLIRADRSVMPAILLYCFALFFDRLSSSCSQV